ncbi:MAG: MGMT family protein [Firmicutes bacterium]|nr:MGMT family protein [Bacillota bacterium]
MNTFQKIYNAVKMIPEGYVATYGQIAAMAGNGRWARIVGYALHVNPDPDHIKCHRVVFKDGSLSPAFAFGGCDEQRRLLEAENVVFLDNGKVDMEKCLYIKSF